MDANQQPASRPEIYNTTVFSYDYSTGKVTTRNYFRNPFVRGPRPPYEITERVSDGAGFWPSLTRGLTFYA